MPQTDNKTKTDLDDLSKINPKYELSSKRY